MKRLAPLAAAVFLAAAMGCSAERGATPSAPLPESPAPFGPAIGEITADSLLVEPVDAASVPLHERPLTRGEARWVRSTLSSMSLHQKAAQLVMVRAFGQFENPRSKEHRELVELVRGLGVGGVVLFDSDVESIPRLLNDLQEEALSRDPPVPLLVAADMERGMAFRVRRGVVPLPYAMAVGATRSVGAARFLGEVTAREGRALGIHWAFAPVADVNNNPSNPVINIRSFGEDPELVASLADAFIRGVQSGGLLATAKHFPGHGDTAVDSHVRLPTVEGDRERLEAVELAPFRSAVNAGVDAVMLGHIAVPALDPSGTPATMSPRLAGRLLRDDLGFGGLIVTDAMEMGGVGPVWTGGATTRAILAGADVILLPPDPRVAVQALARAVLEGVVSEERLDESVWRVLATKARLGLHRGAFVDPAAIGRDVARPEDVERATEIARQSITVLRNRNEVLPLAAERKLRVLHLVMSSGLLDRSVTGVPGEELDARSVEATHRVLGTEVTERTADDLVTRAGEYTHVVISAFVRSRYSQAGADLSPSQARLLGRLTAAAPPVIVVAYGSPYLLGQLPEVDAYVAAYGWAKSSQRAAVGALFGESDVRGKLPVTLPGLHPYGSGLEIPRRSMTLVRAEPAAAGFTADGLAEVDRLLAGFLAERAFPGGVVAVGRDGRLVHLQPFGRQTYDEGSPPVTAETIYDLASLTKVVATTTMAMILVDEGKLVLDSPVADFLPGFRGGGKERVTVRHLLTHSSGIDWWAPLYEELEGQDAYVERIQAMELVYEPGTKSLYSDLGLILLGEILERVAGEPLDAFVRRRVFEPLGMESTFYRPLSRPRSAELLERIAPTERDGWRGRVVHGEVHDENAFALGGVAPHAGLFSTAGDLARFAQMMAWGGVYGHHRLASRATVERFTRPAGVEGSTRALGWDTKSAEGSSAGTLFSASSYGHTGFTGTSLWIDPERELFVILLTNRVHPTRENKLIRKVRPAVADAVIEALAER